MSSEVDAHEVLPLLHEVLEVERVLSLSYVLTYNLLHLFDYTLI